jgi:outer membrane protein W
MKTATTLIISLILTTPLLANDAITIFGGGFSRDQVAAGPGTVIGGTYYPPGGKTEWNGEIGIAASHALNQRWSAEASIAYRQSHMLTTQFDGGFAPATTNARVKTLPIDLSMRFHLLDSSRWQPYVSAGARFVKGPNVRQGTSAPPGTIYQPAPVGDRQSAEVGAGMTVMLTRGFGVRGDVKHLLRNDDSEFDPVNRATFGLEWKY